MKKNKQIDFQKSMICLVISVIAFIFLMICDIKSIISSSDKEYALYLYSLSLLVGGIMTLVSLVFTILSYINVIKYHKNDNRYKLKHLLDTIIIFISLCSIFLPFITYMLIH